MSQILRDARKYEEIMEKKIAEEERPKFHLSARIGWMNDPNGFSFYKGKYHLFYQYNPYESHWGSIHWAHVISQDLLHWEQLPTALAPDTNYDKDGCFSGSAVAMGDGRHLLMYTGVSKEIQPNGENREIQSQCIAIGDGIDYEKYKENPVLHKENLPDNGSIYDFRDPKVWKEEDGSFRCVIGNCDKDKDGQILLYDSKDGIHWNYKKILIKNQGRFGKMWECPDFFSLDGKQVLLVSPQDMLPQGFEYHNGNGTLCFIGEYNKDTETFTEEYNQAIDYGIDFYAPQTVLAEDGRRIMIGWMQNWDSCGGSNSEERPWFGQMSLPRELSIKNGRLYQNPIRELEAMHGQKIKYEDVTFQDILTLDGIKGRKIDMELSIRSANPNNVYRKFAVRFAQNETFQTSVSFRPYESTLKIDRKFSGSRRAIIHQRRSFVRNEAGEIKLRIILDNFSVEIFVNDGEQVLSATIYTDLSANNISFFSDGIITMDVVKYDII